MEIETTNEIMTDDVDVPVNTETVDTSPASDVETAPQETQGALPTEPAYQPNFSYEFRSLSGIREQKEFDERLRSVIKTKEDEDYIRDLVTKADGLDVNKRNLQTAMEEKEQLLQKYSPMEKDVEMVLQMRDNGDIGSVLQALGIEKKQFLKYAYEVATYDDLTPEQKSIYDKKHELQGSSYQLKRQNEQLENRLRSIEIQTRQSDLEQRLNQKEIAPIVQEFDQRNGQNAFWNEVVKRGALYSTQFNQVKQAGELISEIINLYGLKAPQPQQPKPSVSAKPLPVLPNTGSGSSVVPLKQKPTSVKQLKELAREYED
jgi:hypothetical protein